MADLYNTTDKYCDTLWLKLKRKSRSLKSTGRTIKELLSRVVIWLKAQEQIQEI